MAGVLADEGKIRLMEYALGKKTPAMTLKLYKNAVSPSASYTAANLTEFSGRGYASKSLLAASWTVATAPYEVTPGIYVSQATGYTSTQTFAFTAGDGGDPDVIYGYYLVDSADGKLIYAERFATPITLNEASGDTLTMYPTIKLGV